MCTCLNIKGLNHYFGRNMDITHSFNERVIITPRNYKFKFRKEKSIATHYAIIGIGTIIDDYPLYAEASNEKGLSIAGLNFMNNCVYYDTKDEKINLAPFELIPYLLSNYQNLEEVKLALKNINLINLDFSKDVKLTPLHFMISYKEQSIVIETLKEGMKVYDNVFNILTNNPPFYYHQENILNYLNLHNKDGYNNLDSSLDLKPFSYGQGAFGLPGDNSSSSRFIRGFFNKIYLNFDNNENKNILQFFKCLESISMIDGCVLTENGYEYSRYSSCINTDESILYYKTYYNPNIYSINLNKENLETKELIIYPLINDFKIIEQNKNAQ